MKYNKKYITFDENGNICPVKNKDGWYDIFHYGDAIQNFIRLNFKELKESVSFVMDSYLVTIPIYELVLTTSWHTRTDNSKYSIHFIYWSNHEGAEDERYSSIDDFLFDTETLVENPKHNSIDWIKYLSQDHNVGFMKILD